MNQIPNIEETHNTREVEEIVEEIGNLLQEGQYQKAVSTLHHQLQKAREEERERLFKNPLELFRGNRIKMTAEAREALLMAVDIIPDHSELDQAPEGYTGLHVEILSSGAGGKTGADQDKV